MEFIKFLCFVLFLCATAKAFPANGGDESEPRVIQERDDGSSEMKESQAYNGHSVSTTSSLLFKDTKPILTYLLGQPKHQGGLSSPAHLLSPDRYEFFTFDDDGQIVKKLMSVKEIQKIIANNEKGYAGSQGTPIEYYQILTVTPDVESIPSVSRINPNEPLFSIHDVIASVQNVLKSEINIKQLQSKSNDTDSSATVSSNHFEILTEKPDEPYELEAPKATTQTNLRITSKLAGNTEYTESSAEMSNPTIRSSSTELNDSTAESAEVDSSKQQESVKISEVPITVETPQPLPLTASLEPQDPVTLAKEPKLTTQTSVSPSTFVLAQEEILPKISQLTATPETIMVPVVTQDVAPMPVRDAQPPAIISNESFMNVEMVPFTFQQNWRIEEQDAEEEKATTPKTATEGFAKIQTPTDDDEDDDDDDDDDDSRTKVELASTSSPDSESSTSTEKISITPDLANSVSSVLWQIASDNVFIENALKSTSPSSITEAKDDFSEKVDTSETKYFDTSESAELFTQTTQPPSSSSATSVTNDKIFENPIIVLESILRPQNTQTTTTTTTVFSTNKAATQKESETVTATLALSTTTPTNEISTTAEVTKQTVQHYNATTQVSSTEVPEQQTNSAVNRSTEKNVQLPSSTMTPEASVVSVSPDAVFQSPEHTKPVTEKVVIPTGGHNMTSTNETQQTLEGVQVIQEANIGKIPRTTEFPGQAVKDTQRIESTELPPTSDLDLTNSETSTSAVTLSSGWVTESSTLSQDSVNKSETPGLNITGENSQQSTVSVEAELTTENPKQSTTSAEVEITFVPMMIKTPSKVNLKENQTETEMAAKEETENNPAVSETEPPNASEAMDIESKNGELELTSAVSPTSTSTLKQAQKTAAISSVPNAEMQEEMATSKQNFLLSPVPGRPLTFKPIKVRPVAMDSRPSKPIAPGRPFMKEPVKTTESKKPYENHLHSTPSLVELEAAPAENLGLESTTVNLDEDVRRFSDLCNELAFSLWSSVTHNGMSFVRSIVVSPFAVSSLLAMVFLGARGPTSGQMNDILRLDDMVTFNPHLVFRNVTESLTTSRIPGVATAAFVRELYSDKAKGKLLDFYKERAQQFYDGHVEEINFKTVGDTLRRQTNHLVKRQTWGKITDFLRGSSLMPRPPLAAFSANIYQTDCSKASTKDRDGEMYFVILPASRLRRLVPIPAVVWRSDFLAGYEPQLDATAVSISPSNSVVSTIFVLPGQQGLIIPGDTLARLEHHLLGSPYSKGHWSRLMRSLLPRPGLELQVPRLSHRSVINVTASLQRMGLKDLFSAEKADLTGLNGLANDLHLSDMLQVNLFSTCGEEPIGSRHHSEVYPATPILRRDKSSDLTESMDNLFAISDFEDPAISALPLELRPRQARIPLSKPGAKIPEPPRLRFDRPFLFFVRHNPTGMILHMGRFNPRLMP